MRFSSMLFILAMVCSPLLASGETVRAMRAIEAGDIGTLLNDPKIRALMSHPTVQELGRRHAQ